MKYIKRGLKMKSKAFIWIVGFITILLCHNDLNAYSTKVHRKITEAVVDLNMLSLNNYLKNIGLPKGVTESVNNKEVRKWIEDGSYFEDYNWNLLNNPLYSHFYNPLTNRSGVGDLWFSAYDWANALVNPWSWRTARDKLYEGLTLTTKTEREKALSDSFKTLGHMIHLVEDMAVPAHVRGDLHIPFLDPEPYESYTNKWINNLNYTLVPFPYWNLSISPYAPRQFWDLESYNGSIPYGSGYIGLAEYTNANFASNDTIFSETLFSFDPLYFPFPRKSSSILYEETNPQTNKKTKYFKIIKDSENIDHFAVAGRFYEIFEGLPNLQRLLISLDDKCHDDYQKKLIPRAVGYSAGLLNYFFRGKMDMIPDNATGSGYVIENKTDEDMEGTFELWYDDTTDNRKMIWNGYLSIAPNGKSSNITFTPPTDAKSCKYILVLNKGQLGEEQGAVVGKVVNTAENCSALTIVNEDGTPATDTILRNGTLDFKTTDGCCGDIVWSVSVEAGSTLGGSTITQAGVLTAGATACGSLKVTATCAGCGTSATQDLRITNAGAWSFVSYEPSGYSLYDASLRGCFPQRSAVISEIRGAFLYEDHYYGLYALDIAHCEPIIYLRPNTIEIPVFPPFLIESPSYMLVATIISVKMIYKWICP
jgi:hypothetical protein